MKKMDFLKDYEKIADIHAKRLNASIQKTSHIFPLKASLFPTLKEDDIAFLDMMTTRFGKLQDILGAKIFSLILDILGETAITFRDKLNTLEKLKVLEDASWWMELREIRNQLTHDYPDDYDSLAKHLNDLVPNAKKLLDFWETLKKYMHQL